MMLALRFLVAMTVRLGKGKTSFRTCRSQFCIGKVNTNRFAT